MGHHEDEESGCSREVFLESLQCVLTYNGSEHHMIINYSLLLLDIIICGMLLSRSPSSRRHFYAMESLIGVISFQIGLCLLIGCMGISLVWCALCGWYFHQQLSVTNDVQTVQITSGSLIMVIANLAALLYYAASTTAITTLAHELAILLGICCSMGENHRSKGIALRIE